MIERQAQVCRHCVVHALSEAALSERRVVTVRHKTGVKVGGQYICATLCVQEGLPHKIHVLF